MNGSKNVIDHALIADIITAFKKVNTTPGLRIKTGMQALVRIYQSPGHAMPRSVLEKEFGALDLHLGWICT